MAEGSRVPEPVRVAGAIDGAPRPALRVCEGAPVA